MLQYLFQATVSNVCLILYTLFFSVCLRTQKVLLLLSTPTIIALIIQPILIEKFAFKSKANFSKHTMMIMLTLLSILICSSSNMSEKNIWILHFIFIGYSEEMLYRMIILDKLRSSYSIFESIVISSLIFAFLGHISEPIWDNLVIRFPLGVFLGLIRIKLKNIGVPTICHALYNILLTI